MIQHRGLLTQTIFCQPPPYTIYHTSSLQHTHLTLPQHSTCYPQPITFSHPYHLSVGSSRTCEQTGTSVDFLSFPIFTRVSKCKRILNQRFLLHQALASLQIHRRSALLKATYQNVQDVFSNRVVGTSTDYSTLSRTASHSHQHDEVMNTRVESPPYETRMTWGLW